MSFWDDLGVPAGDMANAAGGNRTTAPQQYSVNDGALAGGVAARPDVMQGPMAYNTAQAPQQNGSVGHDGNYNGMSRDQYRDAWQGSGVTDMAGLQNWVQQHGGQVMSGNGTVMTPYGEQIDMLQGARSGHGSAAWGGVGGDGGGGAPGGGGGGPLNFGGPGGYGPGGYGGGPGGPGGAGGPGGNGWSYTPKGFDAFKNEDFQAPDPLNFSKDPSYQFRLQQGQQALQNSAAAKHMVGSGAFAKGLQDYGQGAASQEYQAAYNRALQTNQTNNSGRLNAFNANTNADLGYGNLDLGYTNSRNSYDLGLRNNALGYHSADQSYDLGLRNNALGYHTADQQNGLGWANYGLNADQQQFFQNYQFPINTGLSAAQSYGGYGSQYGANGANTITGGGNAAAAGTVGSANAWAGGLNGAANAANSAYSAYQYGRR